MDWTGWIGRPFIELADDEVPIWVKKNYERQYGTAYDFTGYGIVFTNEDDQVIILTKAELVNASVTLKMTESGETKLNLEGQFSYDYWFDIITPRENSDVHAHFNLSLKQSGEDMLNEHGIPTMFPAIIQHNHSSYNSYYFAGDFVDQVNVPRFYQAKGMTTFKKIFTTEKPGETDSFFWKAYVPIMKTILYDRPMYKMSKDTSGEIKMKDNMNLNGKADEAYLQVFQDGKWQDFLIKGVNIGMAKPGTFPGEAGITKKEYSRWFEMISEMNANSIRIYTIHPPEFYEAFYEHNKDREDPLYLFHGVWINEEQFVEKGDAFDEQVATEFKEEIKRIVDIVHGNAHLEKRVGHASSVYPYDISTYVLGWIIGVEWDPEAVAATNEKNPDKQTYDGTYVYTEEGANPFEVWLAEMMDYLAIYEAEMYEWQHLLSFTNWVTTDLLDHPMEPHEKEDLVAIDPNLIKSKESFYPGLFASYHIYPYYPDFLNLEETYTKYIDHRGKKNNYAGYLNDLNKHHDMPLLVAEFGVPASRGKTHYHIYGADQGLHSEQEQGGHLKSLFEDIVEEQTAGGLVFTWQDEWFKRTWNTMDYDNPDRRPFWDNIQTNEQHFGLLSFEPQTETTLIYIDGEIEDWKRNDISPLYDSGEDIIEKLFVTHDERALYVRVHVNPEKWKKDYNLHILLDTVQNQGQSNVPSIPDVTAKGTDFIVNIRDKNNSNVLIDSYYDSFYYHYGKQLEMIQEVPKAGKKDNGLFHPIRFALNREITIERDGKTISLPFEDYETGKLMFGNGNPTATDFNSLTDYYFDETKGILELRLPWLLLNFKDPSKKEVIGDVWSRDGLASSQFIEDVFLAVMVANEKETPMDSAPVLEENELHDWFSYSWDDWDIPVFHERLKESYFIMQKVFETND